MSTQKKNNPTPPEDKVTQISSARKLLVLGIIVTLIFGAVYWFLDDENAEPSTSVTAYEEEPQFKKEGDLYFLNQDTEDTLSKISIEVAATEEERAQGLMHRSQMADSVGMLFIFEQAEPRSFWMKNTKFPLDIIYVNDNKEIVMIYKGVAPYSTQSVPSYQDAQYVVEVNGGYTTAHNIKEGDHIEFEILQ